MYVQMIFLTKIREVFKFMNKQQLAAKIWESANQMRSKIEANEYKDYILGFIFHGPRDKGTRNAQRATRAGTRTRPGAHTRGRAGRRTRAREVPPVPGGARAPVFDPKELYFSFSPLPQHANGQPPTAS